MVLTQSIGVESGLQYLSESKEALQSRSPNQELLPLTASVNSRDRLEIGGCEVTALVEQFGSPLYILDEETLRATSSQYRDAFKRYYPGESQVLYASKAWSCLAVCVIAASEGLGIDVVSAGEIHTDFIKNFIKAEAVSYDDFVALAGWKISRSSGRSRMEGRDYIVQDGDVIEFKIGK